MRSKRPISALLLFLFAWPVRAVENKAVELSAPYGDIRSEYNLRRLMAAGINTVVYGPVARQADPLLPAIEDNPPLEHGMEKDMRMAKRLGFKVMLKPRLELGQMGSIMMRSEEDWRTWFQNYERSIDAFAGLAQRVHADFFVVGSEYERTTRDRDREWRRIIRSVRAIYTGKVLYSALGLEEADRVTFWDTLDAIAVSVRVNDAWPTTRTLIALLAKRNSGKPVFISFKNGLDEAVNENADWITGVCLPAEKKS